MIMMGGVVMVTMMVREMSMKEVMRRNFPRKRRCFLIADLKKDMIWWTHVIRLGLKIIRTVLVVSFLYHLQQEVLLTQPRLLLDHPV